MILIFKQKFFGVILAFTSHCKNSKVRTPENSLDLFLLAYSVLSTFSTHAHAWWEL